MKPYYLLTTWLCLFALTHSAISFATSFSPQPFAESVQETPTIVRGTVGTCKPDWGTDSSAERRIYTYCEVTVSEVFKGNAPGTKVMIREMGGEKDGLGLHVPGASQYKPGEDVVVFLSEDGSNNGAFEVQGMMMGKFEVYRDKSGQEVLRGPGLTPEPNAQHEKISDQNDTTTHNSWSLASLRDLVQSQAAAEVKSKKSLQSNMLPSSTPSQPAQSSEAAPPLHKSEPEEPSEAASLLFYCGVGLGVLAVLGLLVLLMRKR